MTGDWKSFLSRLQRRNSQLLNNRLGLDRRVHLTRSQSKQLIAVLRLFRKALSDARYRSLKKQIKSAATLLTEERDVYVLRKTLLSVEENGDFRKWVREKLPATLKDVASLKLRRAKKILDAALRNWPTTPKKLPKHLREETGKANHKALKAFKKARKSGKPEDFHSCRTWSKRLLLELKIGNALNAPICGKSLRALDDFQKKLGQGHDLALAESFLRHSSNGAKGILNRALRRISRRRKELERKAINCGEEALHRRFLN